MFDDDVIETTLVIKALEAACQAYCLNRLSQIQNELGDLGGKDTPPDPSKWVKAAEGFADEFSELLSEPLRFSVQITYTPQTRGIGLVCSVSRPKSKEAESGAEQSEGLAEEQVAP
jgi:hypothetical protein